ncbi:hypothetical protein OPT61_g2514 [Boeremia exigua]|uniref:Uncharacterized protein n=1 Tax=Boeremia exigua TaxID=749465 RepID=A0ACC2ILB1_9PLEO|nr:hypothetical protein OPT61_g2514 [Boeremia exigua]
MQRQFRCTDYTVGWVCALPVELAAAQLMFDKRHPDLERDPADSHENLYVLGSISGHNVAIGCLPAGQTGNNSAAVVATQMLATFKKIRFGLVGIGGGVPNQADIRLGDVVVSQPDAKFGGVVQYDMGKTTIDGFQRTGSLNAPPQTLLNALSRIQANEWLEKSGLSVHARRLEGTKFQRSRAGPDVLFNATYDHKSLHSHTCVKCSADEIEIRGPRLEGEEVVVHYGTIASGNRVMKNASERDKASAQLGGVLCFEMEAAGLMNTFPCLVIRGICDYSDTHKNDRWQAYAAGIAAAYAREVLSVIPSTEVADTQAAVDGVRGCSGTPASRRDDHNTRTSEEASCRSVVASDRTNGLKVPFQTNGRGCSQDTTRSSSPELFPQRQDLSDEQRNTIKASLHFKQRDARLLTLKQAQAKTCQWLLKNQKYIDWMHADKIKQHRGFFWIKGKPGSGKSIMMKFLFSHARRSMRKSLVLSFFFNARGETLEKTTSGLYRALVLQLLEKAPKCWEAFEEYEELTAALNLVEESGWQDEVLRQLFIRCLQKLGNHRVVCYVDALDECPEDDIRAMVAFFEEIGEIESTTEFRVCFSSRHYPEISIRTGLQLVLEAEAEHTDDITLYINVNLKIGDAPQFEDVRAEILRKASGIFLWVHLVIPLLNKEFDTGRIKALKKRLAQIPPGLHDLFVDMLTRDQRRLKLFYVSVEIILHAARPLEPVEFRAAAEAYCENGFNSQDHYGGSEFTSAKLLGKFILDASKGLAEITQSKEPTVQWIHESVRDFFLKEDGLSKLRSAEDCLPDSAHNLFVTVCLRQLSLISHHAVSSFATQWPFGSYAVDYILFHANNTGWSDIDRISFLQRFESKYKPFWEPFYQMSHGGIKSSTDMLYYLGDCGAENLVRVHPRKSTHFEIRGGQYDLPLLAALHAGHNAAARAFLDLPPAPEDCGVAGSTEIRPNFSLKKTKFAKNRPFLSYLCEYGDSELLLKALSHPGMRNLGKPLELLDCAASETIVDILVSFFDILDSTYVLRATPRVLATSVDRNMAPNGGHDLPRLRLFLERYPTVTNSTYHWGTLGGLFAYAAARGFYRIARLCKDNASDYSWERASIAAIEGGPNQEGRALVLKGIFEARPDFAHVKPYVPQALFKAICNPHNERVVSQVLNHPRINLESTNHEGMTLLHWALYQGRKTYVKMILDAGGDPNARLRRNGVTALMLAIQLGDFTSSKLILSSPRCKINAQDDYGRTALSWCAMVADDCACKILLDVRSFQGLQPNATDKTGRTALMRAVESANLEIVNLILAVRHIDPDSGPSHRSTPLRLSIKRYVETGSNVFLYMAKGLIEQGAELHCAKTLPTPAQIISAHSSYTYDALRYR